MIWIIYIASFLYCLFIGFKKRVTYPGLTAAATSAGNVQCDFYEIVIGFWKRSTTDLHSFHIRWTFVFMMDIRVYVSDFLLHRNSKNRYLLDHVLFAEILCCFTLLSCPIDIRFMIASSWLYFGPSLYVGPIAVEMYSVTVMTIVIEFCKRSEAVLPRFASDVHSFYVGYSSLFSRFAPTQQT